MAFIFADPCTGYSLMADTVRRGWTVTNDSENLASVVGRWGEKCMRVNSSTLTKSFPIATGKMIFHVAIKIDSANSNAEDSILEFCNNSGADICLRVGITNANAIRVYDKDGSTASTGTAAQWTRGAWHSLAVEADIGNNSGTVKVWFDKFNAGDSPDLSLTGVNMRPSSSARCDQVRLKNNGNCAMFIQDILLYDLSGSGAWSAYLGDMRIRTLLPSGAGSATNWTASAGSNYQCVDDAMSAVDDGDSTYVAAASGAGADLYALANLPSGVTGIVGVVAESTMRKTDAGDPGTLKQRMRASSTNVDSGAIAPSTSYETFQHFRADVPGGTGWTESDVNGLEIGQTL